MSEDAKLYENMEAQIKQLQAECQRKDNELEIIEQILSANPTAFRSFLGSTKSMLDNSIAGLNLHKSKSPDWPIILGNLHSIRGNALLCGLTHISAYFGSLETYCNEQKQIDDPSTKLNIEQKLLAARSELGEYKELLSTKLNFGANDRTELLTQTIHSIVTMSQNALEQLESMAAELGKEVPDAQFCGVNIVFTEEASVPLTNVLNHCFRNAILYGIESRGKRLAAGKSGKGTIFVRVDRVPQRVILSFYDDGMGLDINRMRKIAQKQGLLKGPATNLEVAHFIYEPEVSSGLAAVKAYVEELGGEVGVELEMKDKKGFCAFRFVFKLPLSTVILFRKSKKEDAAA